MGDVVCPTAGWTAKLSFGQQGFNPRILILDLTAIEPRGEVAQVLTHSPVRYEQGAEAKEYDSVSIEGLGVRFSVELTTAE